MNDDLHDIDDLFKKALEQHTDLPSSSVWDNIDKSLDKKKVVSISKKYNKLKWAAAALLLFSFGMAMYTLYTGMKNKELVKENNTRNILKNKKLKTIKKPEDSMALSKEITPGAGNIKSNGDVIKQGNNNIPLTDSYKVDLNEAKNITGKVKIHNNKSVITMQKSRETALANNRKKDAVESMINNIDKGVIVNNREQSEKLNDHNISQEEKYMAEIPVMTESKDMIQTGLMKPAPQILRILAANTGVLKNGKSVTIKQHAIKKENSPSLSATIFFSPDLVSTNLKEDHPHFREDDRHEIEQDEKFKFSSTIGALIDYNTGKNWVLESGLTLSTKVSNIQPKIIYARPDNNGNINYRFNCSAGYSYIAVKSATLPASGDSIMALTSKNTLQYLGVPIAVKYMFTKGRFSISPGIGISANFLTKGKIEATVATAMGDQGAASNDIQGLKSIYFNGSASVSAEYKLSRRFALAFIPTARFALSSINKDAPVKTNLNSIGFAAGSIIRF